MIYKFKFLLFLLFNYYYKDGNYKEKDVPYFTTVLMLMIYQMIIVLMIIAFLEYVFKFSLIHQLVTSGKFIAGTFLFILLYPINNWFFVKKKGFDKLYDEYKDEPINTIKNRRIYGVILIVSMIVLLVLVGNTKYLISLL